VNALGVRKAVLAGVCLLCTLLIPGLLLLPVENPYRLGYDFAAGRLREGPPVSREELVLEAMGRSDFPRGSREGVREYVAGMDDAREGKPPKDRP
jgi:hypothetical protein